MTKTPLLIDYYTDILCVWAWIAQRRVDELNDQFGEQIELRYHYLNLFGDTATRMHEQWSQQGGYDGFAKHVIAAAAPFEYAPVNADIWQQVKPTTSANAHLMIKAVELAHDKQAAIQFALVLRKAFFVNSVDISNLSELHALLPLQHLNSAAIAQSLDTGVAMAALMNDYRQAQLHNIKGSPSYVMDSGRQTLYGNVGYRVLYANIQELLKRPGNEASWC